MKIITSDQKDNKDLEFFRGPGGYEGKRFYLDIGQNVSNFNFYFIKFLKGKQSDEHFHEKSFEMFYTLTRMYIVLNDEPYDLKPHTLIKLQCKDRHKIIAKHNDIEFIAVKLPILKGDKVTTEK